MDWDSIDFMDGTERNNCRKAINRIRVDFDEAMKTAMVLCEGKPYRMAYSKEEADRIGLVYYHWSDDLYNKVFPCYVEFECRNIGLCFHIFNAGAGYQVVTCLGYRTVHKRYKAGGEMQPPYLDLNKMPANPLSTTKHDRRTYAEMVAQLMSAGCNMTQISQYFANNPQLSKQTRIKRLMKTKRIRDMATKEIKDKLSKLGYTDEKVVELMDEAVKIAKKTKNAKALVEAVKEVANWRGFNDKDTHTEERSAEIVNYHEDLQKLEKSEQKIKLTETKEIAND